MLLQLFIDYIPPILINTQTALLYTVVIAPVKFEMRFGPVNNFGGPKRLNVLFSRAKREIHFYSSVKAKDFSKTENQGVLHLKKWFEFMGENNKSSPKEKDITIDTIIDQSNGFHDLLTFTKVLSDRGYSVNQFS